MTQNGRSLEPSRISVLTTEEKRWIDQLVEQVAQMSLEDASVLIEQAKASLDPHKLGPTYERLQITLHAILDGLQALRIERTEGDFNAASQLLLATAPVFNDLGHEELRDLALAEGSYAQAICEVQRSNLGKALELFNQIKTYLRGSTKFRTRFERIIDHYEPDALFIASTDAANKLDYETAGTFVNKAAHAAESVANKYYAEDEQNHARFQGLAYLYRAYYKFFWYWNLLSRFEYDAISSEEDIAYEALLAQNILGKANAEHVIVRNQQYISKSLTELLEVSQLLARVMVNIFSSTFKPGLQPLVLLKEKISTARSAASEAGPFSVVLVRLCNQINDQIKNLERLAKPSKKDFGVFSGLVTFFISILSFLIISWVNSYYEVGLGALKIISSSLVLGLIGGFGLGALKFKNMIFPTRGSNS